MLQEQEALSPPSPSPSPSEGNSVSSGEEEDMSLLGGGSMSKAQLTGSMHRMRSAPPPPPPARMTAQRPVWYCILSRWLAGLKSPICQFLRALKKRYHRFLIRSRSIPVASWVSTPSTFTIINLNMSQFLVSIHQWAEPWNNNMYLSRKLSNMRNMYDINSCLWV